MPTRRRARQRGRGIVLSLACGLLLAGCGGSSDEPTSAEPPSGAEASGAADNEGSGLSVAVSPAKAAPGQPVKASVVNNTDQEFTYGAGYELERRRVSGWEAIELPDRPVIQIAYVAPPGERGPPVRVNLPLDLEPGTYRVVIQRDVPGVGDLSGQFKITGR